MVDLLLRNPCRVRVLQPAGERLNRRLQTGGSATGTPLLDERPQAVPTSGPQIFTGHTYHQSIPNDRGVRVAQIQHTPCPSSEMGSEVRHMVPEMCTHGGVEVQSLEPDQSARGSRLRSRESFSEVPVLQQRNPLRGGAEGAQEQLGGRAVNDVGVRAVEHGDRDQQGPLGSLPQSVTSAATSVAVVSRPLAASHH